MKQMKKWLYSLMSMVTKVGALVLGILFIAVSCSEDGEDSGGGSSHEEEFIPPVVHVNSGGPNSEISVKNLKDDGTVVLSGTSKKVPKSGEILVSGVTPETPQGFLYRVINVKNVNGDYEVKTTEAALEEVLPDFNGEIPMQLGRCQEAVMETPDGRKMPVSIKKAATDIDLISIRMKGMLCTFLKNGAPSFMLLDSVAAKQYKQEDEGTIGLTYDLGAKLSLSLVLETSKGQNRRFGIKGNAEISAELGAKASLKEKFDFGKYELGTINLPSITVFAGVIPIVFTPKWKFYLHITSSGEAYISAKLLSYRAKGGFEYCYWVDGHPLTGKHNVWNGDWSWGPIEDISDPVKAGAKLFEKDNVKLGLKGDLTANFDNDLDVGLYNSNKHAKVTCELTPFIALKGDAYFEFGYNSTEKGIDIDANDEFSLEGGIKGAIKGKINLWKLGEHELGIDFDIFKTTLWHPFGFTMHFDDFKLTQKDDNPNEVYLQCIVTKPFIQILKTQDYGYCFGEDVNNKKSWTYISLKEKYDPMFINENGRLEMQLLLDISNLTIGTKYYVRPYVKYYNTYLYKKGGSFMRKDNNNVVILPDIPGYNL